MMVPEVTHSDQDSGDIDNDLSCLSVASSNNVTSCSEFGSDNNCTTSSNTTFEADEIFDLRNLQSGPVRPILKVNYNI